jgi:hypothetical protein
MALLAAGNVTFIQALERMPEGYVMNKQGLIDEINKQNEMMAQQQEADALSQEQGGMPQEQGMSQEGQPPEGVMKYEDMAAFVDTLAPEVQAELQKITDPNEFEAAVMQLMEANRQGLMNPTTE